MSMTKKTIRVFLLTLLTCSMSSCWEDDIMPEEQPSQPESSISLLQDGKWHEFIFNGYQPLASKPINVCYYIPQGQKTSTMRMLFILPGESRNASDHLEIFIDWANSNKVMIFALQYSEQYYPSTTEYILGGMNTKQSATGLLPREQWSFNYVESLFDELKASTNSNQTTYDMWGHSAGAQFVHRYVTFMPQAHVRKAVACNSGWYTMPDLNATFPYGFSPVEGADSDMQKTLLGRQIYVFVGGDDTSTVGLNNNPGSVEQGENRNQRGHYYFQRSQAIASEKGYPFNWQFGEVPGVGHDPVGMAKGSWKVLE